MVTHLRQLLLAVVLMPTLVMGQPVPLVSGIGYPPFADQRLPGGGIATRVVVAAFERMGAQPTVDWLPWRRGYIATLNGDYAATFPYVRTAERQRDFLYSDPIFHGEVYLYALPEQPEVLTVEGLRNHTLCQPWGWTVDIDGYLEYAIKRGHIRLEQPIGLDTCFEMLRHGRVDAVFSSPEVTDHLLAEMLPLQLVRAPRPLAKTELYLIAPRSGRDSERLLEEFNQALALMKADGSFERLLRPAR
ncbi:MAG: transporter substrate-binding domain-containing protein [Gammaproteobacteria bacterium]|nr:transporter substrate-binding domain-containing protein [Gammaproteobacteria bacterium]